MRILGPAGEIPAGYPARLSGPPQSALQGVAAKAADDAALAEDCRGERCGKRRGVSVAGVDQEDVPESAWFRDSEVGCALLRRRKRN